MNFKTIYQPTACLGGYAFRATSNGKLVHVQERNATRASQFQTKRKMSREEWDAFAREHDLDSPYNDNPSIIARLIGEVER